ncbi:regulator of cell morphogenesis and NO signaling [Tangfeifania diversioriginum]|uniref:Regulator of cell morphogenesis and NO signaling n=1 Tax=Tangfeifania diversioriginum TaxID=1168035 RepID=A0A1M6N0L1_9BACT|nr:iron-sulfur cluster repair di-iron protein [Tangfeifania diversioriginum]SHJ89265.1 regulator of cell morphogenesis and NO signaling [Tangfeifania diversioriginum]
MQITPDTNVGEVVKTNFKAAEIFQANKIDYCCGGEQSISEACQKAGVETEQLISRLEEQLQESDPDADYINSMEMGTLADYIVNRHHSYVQKSIPVLKENLKKIADVHGESHPELAQVRDLFYKSAGELTKHMQKEELMLFPFVKKMERAHNEHKPLPKSPFGGVANPIVEMMEDHENEGERFEQISELTDNYQVPADGCATYQVTMKQLNEFEKDLHRHIHLENNILFQKAITMEKKF